MTNRANEKQAFHQLLNGVLSGRYSRRQAMARAAAIGMSAAAVSTLGMAAGAAPAVTSVRLGAAFEDGTPKAGGVLKVGLQADPTALDPQKQSLTAIWHVVEHIYSRLTRVDASLAVQPELAESWEISQDGITYTFKLRKGVKFHNGREMVAGDVKYSFERLVAPETASTSAADLSSMASIDAPDDGTVVIKLKAPDASFLAVISQQSCIIIPKEVVDENNGDISQVAVGTGPFKFKEYVPNTSVTLEKNTDYWEEGLPYLDGIEMSIIPEDTARTTAVVQGAVDFIEYAPLRDVDTLKGNSDLTLAGDANTNIRFIGFNLTKDPFKNLKVRQAIAAVVDRDAMMGSAVFGHGTPVETLFPPTFWAALKKDVTPPDVEKAKSLMKEAGMEGGFKTTITSWSQYSFLSNAAVVLQEQLKQINIEAELNLVENSTMIQQVYQDKTFDIAVTGDSAYVDPHPLIFSNFGTGESGNFAQYSNPKVDDLIKQGMMETDPAKRAPIYQQIQQILLDDLPWVNLFVANQYEAMKTFVKNYTHIPTGSNLSFREVWLEK